MIGREFEATVVEAVSGIARDSLLDALEAASRAQIVAPLREGIGRFGFAHALIQRTLYEALERRYARDLAEQASAIAYHFGQGVLAGEPLRSVDASLRAADRTASLAAHEEAKAHLERALATLDQASLDEPERRYRALMRIGQALRTRAISRTSFTKVLAELGRSDEARSELDAFDDLALPRRGWSWPLALRQSGGVGCPSERL